MIDQFGRSIDYLRLSVTDKCNLSCQTCVHRDCDEHIEHEALLTFFEMDKIVGTLSELGIEKVRITGGEPLLRANIEQLIALLCRHGGINEVTLTTNGYLLAEKAEQLKLAGLRRVNINLNTLREERYREMTQGGNLDNVLKGIEAAKKAGLTPVKINVCIMHGVNEDEVDDFIQFSIREDVEVRFIEWVSNSQDGNNLFVSNNDIRNLIPNMIPLSGKETQTCNRQYTLTDTKAKIGFISPISQRFCGSCNCIRLTADGFLKGCLHDKEEVAIKQMLSNERLLEHVLRRAIFQKDEFFNFEAPLIAE